MTTKRLRELAKVVRSKNSGPFEITFDVIFDDLAAYERVKASGALTVEGLCRLYGVSAEQVVTFMFFDPAKAFKLTLKRTWAQGSVGERDTFGAQQHAPLLDIEIPMDANMTDTATATATASATPMPLAMQPEFDVKEFRRALGSFPTGVAIITMRGPNGEPVGLTCNSFSSVSLEPPLVLWSLRKASKSIEIFRASKSFAIHVLAEDQDQLSQRFATSSIANKFEGVASSTGYDELPLIDNCVARFQCSMFAQHEAGDHVIFIGKVEQFEVVREEDPLVFYKGAYMMLTQSLRELAQKGRISHRALAQARRVIYGTLVQLACENGEPADFDAIESNLRLMEAHIASGNMPERMAAALVFFDLISRAARNDVMTLVAQSLNTLLQQTVKAQAEASHASQVYVPELNPIRWNILAAMRAKDVPGAVAAVNLYVERATDH
jgi:flavin reductase (DIM6/NTAB) family NADH-FMN oxidoreductase RutF